MKTTVFYTLINGIESEQWEELKNGLPWEERRARAEKLKDGRARMHCIGAGALLYDVLRETGVENFELERDEHGKPRLKNEQGIFFNLSHGGDYCACAISDRPVGVDVEAEGRGSLKIAERFFTEAEYNWIAEDEALADERFTRLWTRKESYAKLKGLGLGLSFSDFEVIPGREKAIDNSVIFSELALAGHRAAACTFDPDMRFEKRELV